MHLAVSYRYQMNDHKKDLLVFYIAIVCLYLLMLVTTAISTAANDREIVYQAQSNGINVATMVFLFIAGLNSFKENFGMLLQNGVSRRTMFTGRLLTMVSLCVGMTLMDRALLLLFRGVSALTDNSVAFGMIFDSIYPDKAALMSPLGMHAYSLALDFAAYLGFAAAGYLLTLLFYRLGKTGKVAVGAGVPVLLCVVLPALDGVLTGGRTYLTVAEALGEAFLFSPNAPLHMLLLGLGSCVVCSGLSWLLMRRAVVKA